VRSSAVGKTETCADQVAGMMKVILGATREHQSGNLCEW
jgi:hypothetical protein